MARLKKPIDYIRHLRSSHETRRLGESLHGQYVRWTGSLRLRDFLSFIQIIQDSKDRIGAPQLFGKFRAYSFEEFLYRLIQAKVSIPKALNVYWGEKCLTWKGDSEEYGMELDVVIGKKLNRFIQPTVAIDAKVELDASRLKTSLASFLFLKRGNPDVRCFLVYMLRDIDALLLKLAEPWIDGICELSVKKDETAVFIDSIQQALVSSFSS